MKELNENTKVTLTVGQLKRLISESMNASAKCKVCGGNKSDKEDVHDLHWWMYKFISIGSPKHKMWNNVRERFNELSFHDQKFVDSEIDERSKNYCELCALDTLNDLIEECE